MFLEILTEALKVPLSQQAMSGVSNKVAGILLLL
jgi:hypothetical protein